MAHRHSIIERSGLVIPPLPIHARIAVPRIVKMCVTQDKVSTSSAVQIPPPRTRTQSCLNMSTSLGDINTRDNGHAHSVPSHIRPREPYRYKPCCVAFGVVLHLDRCSSCSATAPSHGCSKLARPRMMQRKTWTRIN